jgi:hypothetical protein
MLYVNNFFRQNIMLRCVPATAAKPKKAMPQKWLRQNIPKLARNPLAPKKAQAFKKGLTKTQNSIEGVPDKVERPLRRNGDHQVVEACSWCYPSFTPMVIMLVFAK